jgi:hypothetical protein
MRCRIKSPAMGGYTANSIKLLLPQVDCLQASQISRTFQFELTSEADTKAFVADKGNK